MVRGEGLPIEKQLRIELAGSPALEDAPHGGFVDAKQLRERRNTRRQRDDRPDVQVAIGPRVAARADAGRERVVDRAVA